MIFGQNQLDLVQNQTKFKKKLLLGLLGSSQIGCFSLQPYEPSRFIKFLTNGLNNPMTWTWMSFGPVRRGHEQP